MTKRAEHTQVRFIRAVGTDRFESQHVGGKIAERTAGIPLERGWSDAALLERCPVGLQRARQPVEGRQGLLVGLGAGQRLGAFTKRNRVASCGFEKTGSIFAVHRHPLHELSRREKPAHHWPLREPLRETAWDHVYEWRRHSIRPPRLADIG